MGAFLLVSEWVWASQKEGSTCCCEVSGKTLSNHCFVPGSCQTVLNMCGFIWGWSSWGARRYSLSERSVLSALWTGSSRSCLWWGSFVLACVRIKAAFSPVLKAGIQKKYWCPHGVCASKSSIFCFPVWKACSSWSILILTLVHT